jgi:hypothetical protein
VALLCVHVLIYAAPPRHPIRAATCVELLERERELGSKDHAAAASRLLLAR